MYTDLAQTNFDGYEQERDFDAWVELDRRRRAVVAACRREKRRRAMEQAKEPKAKVAVGDQHDAAATASLEPSSLLKLPTEVLELIVGSCSVSHCQSQSR